MIDIKTKVAEKLNSSSTIVVETVVDKLVQIELDKRVGIVTQAITKQEQLNKEFLKINGKCDNVSYDKDGIKQESMSQKRFDEIKKAKEQLDNFSKAFELALETNTQESYTKLNGLLGGNNKESSSEVKSEA